MARTIRPHAPTLLGRFDAVLLCRVYRIIVVGIVAPKEKPYNVWRITIVISF
jgi:hypothetical protein